MQENIVDYSYVSGILKLNLYMHTIFISLQKNIQLKAIKKKKIDISSPHFITKLNLLLHLISFLTTLIFLFTFSEICFLINQNICYGSF